MTNHLRFEEYLLTNKNGGISVHEEERKWDWDETDDGYKNIARLKMFRALTGQDHLSLDTLRAMLNPKKGGGYAEDLNFRTAELKVESNKVLIEKAAREVVFKKFREADRDEAVSLLMQIIELNAARKEAILKTINTETANTIAKVMDPNWRPSEPEEKKDLGYDIACGC